MNPPNNLRSASLPTDSSTHVIQLLHQLQGMVGSLRDDPVSVLTTCVERIELLQAQCVVLERRVSDSTISCAEVEQRAMEAEQRVLETENQLQHNHKVIEGLLAVASPNQPSSRSSPSSTTDTLSRSQTPSYTPEQANGRHLQTFPQDSNMTNLPFVRQSSGSTLKSDSSHMTGASTISCVVDRAGNVIQCSAGFADLFGFNYFRARSHPGVYNMFTLAPLNHEGLSRILQQSSMMSADSSPLNCILAVEGWYNISTVVMSLRPMRPEEAIASQPHDTLYWAWFDVVGTREINDNQSSPVGRTHPSMSYP